MGLNRELGEYMPEFGHQYRVVKTLKWSGSPFMETACQHAAGIFKASGALSPVRFFEDEILIQEYPVSRRLLFLFCKRVNGNDLYTHYVFDLSPAVIEQFRVSNMWDDMPAELRSIN